MTVMPGKSGKTDRDVSGLFPVTLDLMVEAGGWQDESALRALAESAVGAVADELRPVGAGAELSLVFTDDAHIRALNARWRGRDGATNVLSFPAGMRATATIWPAMLGDIVLAFETVGREAAGTGKPFENHLAHLIVHGVLHLLGYDHEDEPEAEEMERVERSVLARLAIPDPYT